VTARRARGRPGPWLAVAATFIGPAALAQAPPVTIAVVAPEGCPPALRERIAEQVADVAGDLAWSCPPRLDEDEPFRSAPAAEGLQFWIDLTPEAEARLTLRDGRSDRFVVRRIPLPRGLDEIGREEIGQIVRSALLALRAGGEETLTLAEARAEIARWPRRSAPPPPRPPPVSPPEPTRVARTVSPGRPLALVVGAFLSWRVFAPQIPLVGEAGIGLGIGRWGPVGGWLEAAYQPEARYDGSPVSVALVAVAGRAGLDASARLAGTFRLRLGAGAGLTRTTFTPEVSATTGAAAPAGTFSYLTGRALAGWQGRLGGHVAATLTFFLDVVGADVHYDLREPDGSTRRVLVPHRFQPGMTFEIAWSR